MGETASIAQTPVLPVIHCHFAATASAAYVAIRRACRLPVCNIMRPPRSASSHCLVSITDGNSYALILNTTAKIFSNYPSHDNLLSFNLFPMSRYFNFEFCWYHSRQSVPFKEHPIVRTCCRQCNDLEILVGQIWYLAISKIGIRQ